MSCPMGLFSEGEMTSVVLFWEWFCSEDAQHRGDSFEAAAGPLLSQLLA